MMHSITLDFTFTQLILGAIFGPLFLVLVLAWTWLWFVALLGVCLKTYDGIMYLINRRKRNRRVRMFRAWLVVPEDLTKSGDDPYE